MSDEWGVTEIEWGVMSDGKKKSKQGLSNSKYYFIYFNTTLYKTYNINGLILAFNTIK